MEKLTLLLIFMFAALLVAACGTDSNGPPMNGDQAQLDQNRQLWESDGFESYEMDFQWHCFCHPDYTLPVVVTIGPGNAIGSVVSADDGSPVDQTVFIGFSSVDGLFDLIQEAIDLDAVRISVQYHPDQGYPSLVDIDYVENVADEELGFEVFAVSAR